MIVGILFILVSLEASAALEGPDENRLPEKIDFKVACEDTHEEINVGLIPVKTFLAGINLPVWIVTEKNPETLEPLTNVMEEIGPFSPYWDSLTCSAALFFHKTNKLEGTIGHHHILHELIYDPIKSEVNVSDETLLISPLMKHDRKLSEPRKPEESEDEPQAIGIKSLHDYPDTVYIETLVIVNYDITEDFNSNYVSLVVYLLTLFNTVDSLYATIDVPSIKINLAGIIIGNTKLSFPKLKECYQPVIDEDDSVKLDALYISCVFRAMRNSIKKYHLSFDSYDIVVFLTRSPLSDQKDGIEFDEIDDIFGVSREPDPESDGYKRLSTKNVGLSIISEPRNLERFFALAHEMAHLLGVPHDGGPLWGADGVCTANLMRNRMSCCKECLKFGGKSPEFFKKFFGTRDSCRFRNEPRSLHDPPGPRLFWKTDDQCKCYGYHGAYSPIKKNCDMHLTPEIKCQSALKCRGKDEPLYKTDNFMDGTPCQLTDKKIATHVCWNRECVPIQKDTKQP